MIWWCLFWAWRNQGEHLDKFPTHEGIVIEEHNNFIEEQSLFEVDLDFDWFWPCLQGIMGISSDSKVILSFFMICNMWRMSISIFLWWARQEDSWIFKNG
jgi:hypothetical protein